MISKAEEIRYQNDFEMFESLLKNREVSKVNEMIERRSEEGPIGIRRRLLATSVRLSRNMSPEVHRMADECIETLGMDIPLELYVYASAQFNAACFKPEDGRLFVMFSSSLLEAFRGSELKFVIGHEFGHYVYRHHDIPIGYLLKGARPVAPKLALELFAWSRNAEVSADRAGALCANDLAGVARSLFKLASGLSDKIIRFDLDEFLQQVDEMQLEDEEPGRGSPREDWFSTHPFSPLRVHALKLFHESALMSEGGISLENLEVGVHRLMSLMEPSYLDSRTDAATAMRRALYAGTIVVADADGSISKEEVEIFEKFFGKGEFTKDLNIRRIKNQLQDRIEKMNELTSPTQRMQVLRDLCLVSRANGKTEARQREVLNHIADLGQVPRTFICQSLEMDCAPD